MKSAYMLVMVIFLMSMAGCSKPAAPYTEEALQKLTASSDKMGQPIPPVGSSTDDKVKYVIDYYKEIYDRAGYSLDKSIAQFAKDYEKDTSFFQNPVVMTKTPVPLTITVIYQLNGIGKTTDISKYFSKEAIDGIQKMSEK